MMAAQAEGEAALERACFFSAQQCASERAQTDRRRTGEGQGRFAGGAEGTEAVVAASQREYECRAASVRNRQAKTGRRFAETF